MYTFVYLEAGDESVMKKMAFGEDRENITYREAIREALVLEMRRDPMVVLMGEDIAGGSGKPPHFRDAWGGPFGVTKGLYSEFGESRVLDTPISESAFIGAGVGGAATGLRPVVELMFVDFFGVAMDQIMNQAAKLRYMFGGEIRVPLVIRTTIGAGSQNAAQHSQIHYSLFTHIPGLKTVAPSTPYDAKGLLITAIRDDDPVIFFENKILYDTKGSVPIEPYFIPFGEADVKMEGDDVTIVAVSRMVHTALNAAQILKEENTFCEVIDLRTLMPLDEEAVIESVRKTGRLVIVDEDNPRCSIATDIAALVAEKGFKFLEAPILRVTPPHTPVPFSKVLEDVYLPNEEKVVKAVKSTLG
jgi:pyruvate/2-oxoglutarate/acetoin dehydrogenase E1 component